jgi:mono/diheme cytochrome c family protein
MYEGPSWLLLSESLHLVAAGAWLGGLLPLLALVAAVPAEAALRASRRFSPLGTACAIALAATALFQSWVLIGGVPGWIGTGYGLVALAKLALFLVLLGFAARNRLHLSPALASAAAKAKRALVRSIAWETGAGLLVVLAAGLLTSLPPAMHEQPVWTFAWRVSLDAVQEDADFRREAVLALVALAGAVAVLAAALAVRRRLRWGVPVAALAAAAVAWVATPHLGVLLADAYPTYYWHSPSHFATASIAEGEALFPTHCAACHGADGRGDGPAAAGLSVPPANLTAAHLWMHADGELFWWSTHGIEAPDGGTAMPGFGDQLTEDQRWALIDWVRAHNAGLARAFTGAWPVPLRAPGLDARCAGGRDAALADLRAQPMRLVFGAAPPAPGLLTILVTPGGNAQPAAGLCVADDATIPSAYAAILGTSPAALPGTQVLVDGQGWLRAVQAPGAGPGWGDPGTLAAALRDIAGHPLAAVASAMPAGMKM